MINTHNTTHWLMATNATTCFHVSAPQTPRQFTSPKPYLIMAQTEDALMEKVFVNPQRNADGEYDISALTPKAESDIVAEIE